MKCEICKEQIKELFLKKVLGTYIKDEKGKRHIICGTCQTKFDNNKEEMLKNL